MEYFRTKDPTVSDQYLPPFVIVDDKGMCLSSTFDQCLFLMCMHVCADQPIGTIQDGDAVASFNFRGDRMIEISKAFEYENDKFPYFDRIRHPKVSVLYSVCLTDIKDWYK